MKKILFAELKYNIHLFGFLALLFPAYTIFCLTDTQIIADREFDVDVWGGVINAMLSIFLYIIFIIRYGEKRTRLHALLPVSQKENAKARMLLALLPMLFFIIYLLIMHLILISKWREETESIAAQMGFLFVTISLFILVPDLFRYDHKIKKVAAITGLVIGINIIFGIALIQYMRDFGRMLILIFGEGAYSYRHLIFYLWAGTIFLFTVKSYRARQSYFA